MDSARLLDLGYDKVTKSENKTITGGYCGDLLSWVMGRARTGDVWFTIMGNMNMLAVASLTETAAIVLCDGVTLADDVISKANEENINIYCTKLSVYEATCRFHDLFTREVNDN